MTQNNIGKVIRFLREEKGISIKKIMPWFMLGIHADTI